MNRSFGTSRWGPLLAGLLLAGCTAGPGPSMASLVPTDPGVMPSADAAASHEPMPSADGASGEPDPSALPPLTADSLHAITLTDVRSGEQLTLGQLAAQKPLLLETMAIWCSNCRAQQHNVVAAHNEADFGSISLDVDPGEQPDDLAAYADREGFDWHFAMADASLLGQLRDRFGTAVAVPPGMPKILFRTDGSIELIGLGELYTAQQIADAVGG
jgi:hypothetical protein